MKQTVERLNNENPVFAHMRGRDQSGAITEFKFGAVFDALLEYARGASRTEALSYGGFAMATAKKNVKSVATISARLAGALITKAPVDDASGWVLTGGNLANSGNDTRGYLLCLDAAGAPTVVASADAADVASLLLPAYPADKVVVGWVTIINASAGAYVPGTTDLDTAGLTVAYNPPPAGLVPYALATTLPSLV